MKTASKERSADTRVELRLIDGFQLAVDDQPVDLPLASQRLVAFLALHDRPLLRSHVANSLWMDRTEDRASACLRSALWRSNREAPLVKAGRTHLKLGNNVAIDVSDTASLARSVIQGDVEGDISRLCGELLPDWYDDWVLLERVRLTQLCLNALERLSVSLLQAGQTALAVDSALAVVLAEPLRESAYRVLIEAHLVAGNRSEALRVFRRCESGLYNELGLRPSEDLLALLRSGGFPLENVHKPGVARGSIPY